MLTEDQKKIRLQGVGGSEVAAVAGIDPFRGPLDVYMSKVEGKEFEGNFHTERGTYLEPGIAAWAAFRLKATLREVGTIIHPRNPLVICTPDRLMRLDTKEVDLSIKAPGPRSVGWGAAWTDQIPDVAMVQVQWELSILEVLEGITQGYVAAPVDGDLRIYIVKADHELQGMLVEKVERFWKDYVLTRTPPPFDGTKSSTELLAQRFPEASAEELSAPESAARWVKQFSLAKETISMAEVLKSEAENCLKGLMGNYKSMSGPGFKLLWSNVKASQYTVDKKAGRRFSVKLEGAASDE